MDIRSGAGLGVVCKGVALAIGGGAAIAALGGPLGALAYIGLSALKNEFQAEARCKDPSVTPLADG